MATWVDYRGMQVPDSSTGDAGIRLTDNFTELADRAAPINYTASSDPGANDDVDAGFYIGSHWLNTVTPEMWICLDNTPAAAVWQSIGGVTSNAREILTANRTYYVRTDGDDANDGLSNTSGGAFLTVQHAVDVVMSLDIRTHNVTIQLADGTYSDPTLVNGPWLGSGTVTLLGNTAHPENVILSAPSQITIWVRRDGRLVISGFELASGAGHGLQVDTGSSVLLGAAMRFGSCGEYQLCAGHGGVIEGFDNYTIAGNAWGHILCLGNSFIRIANNTVTLTGTPAFSVGYIEASRSGIVDYYGNTFSGSATGKRFNGYALGNIFTNYGGASYLPGNAAGTLATNAIYN